MMKPLYLRSVVSKDAGRPRLTHHHRADEMNEVNVEKWWNENCDKVKREKPRQKSTQTSFRSTRTDRDAKPGPQCWVEASV